MIFCAIFCQSVNCAPLFGAALPGVVVMGDLATKLAAAGAAKLGVAAAAGLAVPAFRNLAGLFTGLTQEQLKQLRMLTPQQIEMLRQLRPEQVEMLRNLDPKQIMLLMQPR